MNERDFTINTKERTEEIREVQEKRKETYVGSVTPQRGHRMFEYDIETKALIDAVFEQQDIVWNPNVDQVTPRRKIVMKPNCLYVSALNKKNAIKHLKKRGYEVVEIKK